VSLPNKPEPKRLDYRRARKSKRLSKNMKPRVRMTRMRKLRVLKMMMKKMMKKKMLKMLPQTKLMTIRA
jgi:hypothetical protein